MSKTLQIAENLATFTANHERVGDIFAPAVSELCRLAVIEKAANALIKCKCRYHAELNTKALAEALGIELPQQSVSTESDDSDGLSLFEKWHLHQFVPTSTVVGDVRQAWMAAISLAVQPSTEALLQQALKALEYHTNQTRPIEQTEKMIATLQAHCTPQHAKQEQPGPSTIELQDAEIGIPEPVTELINPAPTEPLTRAQALAWAVDNIIEWPTTHEEIVRPQEGSRWGWCLGDGQLSEWGWYLLNYSKTAVVIKKEWEVARLALEPIPFNIKPAPLTRNQALAWLVENVKVWPTLWCETWDKNFDGCQWMKASLMIAGEVKFSLVNTEQKYCIEKQDWQAAQLVKQ